MKDLPTYVLERAFNAPSELVWKCWTDPELLPRWYGPNAKTIIHSLELRPGRSWLLEMKWGGSSHYQRVDYIDVLPSKRLVWLHSNSDADWNVIPSPVMTDWPRVLLTTVTFEESGTQTKLRLTWVPYEASEAEISGFVAAMAAIDKGWSAGMEILAALLAELQSRVSERL